MSKQRPVPERSISLGCAPIVGSALSLPASPRFHTPWYEQPRTPWSILTFKIENARCSIFYGDDGELRNVNIQIKILDLMIPELAGNINHELQETFSSITHALHENNSDFIFHISDIPNVSEFNHIYTFTAKRKESNHVQKTPRV